MHRRLRQSNAGMEEVPPSLIQIYGPAVWFCVNVASDADGAVRDLRIDSTLKIGYLSWYENTSPNWWNNEYNGKICGSWNVDGWSWAKREKIESCKITVRMHLLPPTILFFILFSTLLKLSSFYCIYLPLFFILCSTLLKLTLSIYMLIFFRNIYKVVIFAWFSKCWLNVIEIKYAY